MSAATIVADVAGGDGRPERGRIDALDVLRGFGLELVGTIGTATAIGVGLALFTVQAVIASAWLRRLHCGPVEWLWRSLTRLERMPFARAA